LRDDAAAVGVVIEDIVEGAETAVVHVGGADAYVAQGGWTEFAHVCGVVSEFVEAKIVGGVGEFAGEVVEAVADEGLERGVLAVGSRVARWVGLIHGDAAEGESAVAAGAGEGLMKEDVFAALGGVGDGVGFVAVTVVVVGAVAGDQGAFEGSEGFADVVEGVRSLVVWEGLREELDVDRVGGDDSQEFVVLLLQAKFNWIVVEERGDGLVFELGDGGVGPVEDGEPGDVGEGHDAAGVKLAGDSDGYG